MTIGIGALATEGAKEPNYVILCSDWLGSFGDRFSTPSLYKIFSRPSAKIFAVGAGDLTKAGELVTKIAKMVEASGDGVYGKVYDAIFAAVHEYKSARFRYEVVAQYGLSPAKGWMDEAKKLGLLDTFIKKLWPSHSLGCELVLGAFVESGFACLFHIDRVGFVHPITMPGFAAIGTGDDNAAFWLAYRGQHSGMSLRRSAYHVYEAKLMAEKSPYVGKDDMEMLVASAEGHYSLYQKAPEQNGCPISLIELKELWGKYGVPTTDRID